MRKKLTVMVTGVAGGGVGEQIIKALRLSEINYRIVGTDITPYSKGLMEVDAPYLLPPASDPSYIDKLLALCRAEKVQAIFPGSEPELSIISRVRKLFSEGENIFLPINPEIVIDIGLNKSKTVQFLSEKGYPFPKTVIVESIKDAKRIDFFPVVVKPKAGSSGSKDVFITQNEEELVSLLKYLYRDHDKLIVQEYIGGVNAEFTVGVLISMDGKLINSIAVKRDILSGLSNKVKVINRSGNQELGSVLAISTGITQGEIGKFPEVSKTCEELALAIGCRSTINIQCRLVNDEVHVFEINPRFSGTTSFRAMVGFNEPDLLLRKHILGERIEKNFRFRSGVIMRGLAERLIDPDRAMKVARQ